MEVSISGYYAWRERPLSARGQANRELVAEIRAIHTESRKSYGSPRIHAELVARGFRAGKNRVARLMRAEDIRAQRKRSAKEPRIAGIITRSLQIGSTEIFRPGPLMRNGWAISPSSLQRKVGCIWQRSWISSLAKWLDGQWKIPWEAVW